MDLSLASYHARIVIEPIACAASPAELLDLLAEQRDPILLESSASHSQFGRHSVIACCPIEVLTLENGILRDSSSNVLSRDDAGLWSALRDAFGCVRLDEARPERPQLQGAIVVQASSPADPDNAKGVQARRPHHKTATSLACLPPVTKALSRRGHLQPKQSPGGGTDPCPLRDPQRAEPDDPRTVADASNQPPLLPWQLQVRQEIADALPAWRAQRREHIAAAAQSP